MTHQMTAISTERTKQKNNNGTAQYFGMIFTSLMYVQQGSDNAITPLLEDPHL